MLLAGALPVSPGVSPRYVDVRSHRPASQQFEDPWQAVEDLQMRALEQRRDRMAERFQNAVTRGFFFLLPLIHLLCLSVLGATVAGWSGLVFATFLVSRRAAGEAVFWSLWLLAAGFFLGIGALFGFAYAFHAVGPSLGLPNEVLVYSIWNVSVPASWIIFVAAAGNAALGLVDLDVSRRSSLAGLAAAANAGAILVLGTTSRLTLSLGLDAPPMPQAVLSYFEGRLVHSNFMTLVTAPLATLGVVIGVALALGGACYGLNSSD